MKQNITLSLEKKILKKGKILAARKDASISRMLSDHLKEMIESEDRYQSAKRHAVQVLKKGFSMGGQKTWTREELYER